MLWIQSEKNTEYSAPRQEKAKEGVIANLKPDRKWNLHQCILGLKKRWQLTQKPSIFVSLFSVSILQTQMIREDKTLKKQAKGERNQLHPRQQQKKQQKRQTRRQESNGQQKSQNEESKKKTSQVAVAKKSPIKAPKRKISIKSRKEASAASQSQINAAKDYESEKEKKTVVR